MTSRFYFDLNNGQEYISDNEGVDASDLDEAIKQVEVIIAELRASGELARVDSGWKLCIRDEAGLIRKRIPVR